MRATFSACNLDTCHVTDAGYDIGDDNLDGVPEEFDRNVIGLDRLAYPT